MEFSLIDKIIFARAFPDVTCQNAYVQQSGIVTLNFIFHVLSFSFPIFIVFQN